MKTGLWKLSALTSALILAGCGGSSTTDNANTTASPLSKISGTVPGTLIEAFCTDGSYYQVNSTQNNTSEHPFEIEVPKTVDCSLVMTTNEDNETTRVITQIGLVTSDANGTLFRASEDIDLGYIPLAMDPSEIKDANGDHVSDDVLTIQVDGTHIKIETENPLDRDHDGLVNIYEDDDEDSISNYYDDDDDGDGIKDSDHGGEDHDNDHDNINNNDNDYDGDGIDDDKDIDDDNDGIIDDNDPDENDHSDGHDDNTSNNTTNIPLPIAYKPDAGRLLGAQCAQCHGTNGVSSTSWDSIAGESNLRDEIYEDDAPIMMAQAHGYTSEEITLIGNWLKTLSKND